MTLKASKNKLNPAVGLLGFTISKNIGIIILMVIGILIFCPGLLLATFQNVTFKQQNFDAGRPEYLNMVFGFCGVLSAIIITIANYINFSYLYKKSSSDVFHALPLTRTKLLISRAAASFISVLIPLTIGYLSLYMLTAFYPSYALGTFSQIASAYLVNVISVIMVSAYSLIFIVCAGSAFDLVLSYVGFNVAVLVIGSIISSVSDKYLSGYSTENTNAIMKTLSPLVFCGMSAEDFAFPESGAGYFLSQNGGFLLKVSAFAVIFLIASIILYNYRKSERGGQAYAYKFIYIICSVLAGICGGYLLSRIFILPGPSKNSDLSIVGIISFIAGALITTVVYGAVTDRGFKKFRKSLIYGAASVVLYFAVIAVVFSGAFGFSGRVPEIKNIEKAILSFNSENIELSSQSSEKLTALHKAIIDREADDDVYDTVDTPHTYLNLTYELKDGSKMSREYFVDIKKIDDELFALYSGKERFAQIYSDIDNMGSRMVYLDVEKYENYETTTYAISKDQLKALVDTYKNELPRVGKKVLSNEENIVRLQAYSHDQYYEGAPFYVELTDDFTDTIALMENFVAVESEG